MEKFNVNKIRKIAMIAGWNEIIDGGYNFSSFIQVFENDGSYWDLNEWLFEQYDKTRSNSHVYIME